MLFRLKPKTGNHAQKGPDGKIIIYCAKDGNIIESDIDLYAKFPNKFERADEVFASFDSKKKKPTVQKAVKKEVEEPALEVADEPEEVADEPEEEKAQEPLGKDVTKNFPRAGEEDFKVFYSKGKGYFVTESDDPFTALNKKRLKKELVTKFIEKYLKG